MSKLAKDVPLEKGTIVAADFPFIENLSRSKIRPCLILWANNKKDSFILAFMTTKLLDTKEFGDIHINKLDSEFSQTGLVNNSKIKLSKLITSTKERIKKKYGTLSENMIKRIDEELKIIFKL